MGAIFSRRNQIRLKLGTFSCSSSIGIHALHALEPIEWAEQLDSYGQSIGRAGIRNAGLSGRNSKSGKPTKFPSGLLEIEFGEVNFGYGRETLLSNFSLKLERGGVTALVGHTGAGKSTVANLLQRYYDVGSGSVTINGVDVREFDSIDLRKRIGVVAQDPFLFDGTVRDNLKLAKQEATEEELVAALQGAVLGRFVSQLPDQMDTSIGERGIRLSMEKSSGLRLRE